MSTAAHEADVIVVGAGAAGAAAVLEADAARASVIAIDQLPGFGGTAAISGGGCCIGATPLQAERGIADSPELALRDILAAGDGEADEVWARFYVENARTELYDWLIRLGVEFVDVRGDEYSSVPRSHSPHGNGRGLMDVLWGAIERRGLADRWRFATTFDDLVVEDGAAVGVRARAADGTPVELRGRAVVVATGGFAGSHAEVLRYAPRLRDVERVLVGGGPGALGTGHRILAGHGAALTHTDELWSYVHATPDPRDATGERGLVIRRIPDAIWANRAGRRFHDESLPGPGTGTPAVLAQEPPTCWAILDRPSALGMSIADPRFRNGPTDRIDELIAESPFIHAGDGAAELGRASGIDPPTLAATVDAWNALVASGADSDPQTGRSLSGARPLDTSPLYAVQFLPLARKSLGGVQTDLRCRVLRDDGIAIPGLYAAGELTGFGGGHLSGRRALEGIMIGGSLFSGRVAGAWAAHKAGGAEPARWATSAASGAATPTS